MSSLSGIGLLITKELNQQGAEKTGQPWPVLPPIPESGEDGACPSLTPYYGTGRESWGTGAGATAAKVLLKNGLGRPNKIQCRRHKLDG